MFLLLFLDRSPGVVLGQVVCKLLVWRLGEDSLLPQIRGQVAVCVGNSCISSLGCKRQMNGINIWSIRSNY